MLYGAGSTLVNIFHWTGGSRGGERLQQFQQAFLRKLLKNCYKNVFCELILGRLFRPWLIDSLIFFSTRLHRILYKLLQFYLNLTITKFYLYFMFHCVTDQAKQISYHCPVKTNWQGRWWRCSCQTKATTLSILRD